MSYPDANGSSHRLDGGRCPDCGLGIATHAVACRIARRLEATEKLACSRECGSCGGSGRTSTHVTGEVECAECNGSGRLCANCGAPACGCPCSECAALRERAEKLAAGLSAALRDFRDYAEIDTRSALKRLEPLVAAWESTK